MDVVVKISSFMEYNLALKSVREDKAYSFTVERKGVGSKHVKQFTQVFKENKSLRKLNFQDNVIDDDGAEELAKGMKVQQGLVELNLMKNRIGSAGLMKLCDAMQLNKSINKFNFSWNDVDESGANRLALMLQEHSSLVDLRVDKVNMSAAGAEALAKSLSINCSLVYLDLGRNNISDSGAQAISRALQTNQTLLTLILARNSITDTGAECIKDLLSKNETLVTLDLKGNKIEALGASYLAVGLKENHNLFTLALSNNRIKDTGAGFFAEALKVNTSLGNLFLASNEITDAGGKLLLNALETNHSLVKLGIVSRLNKLDESVVKAFDEKLEANMIFKREEFLNTLNSDSKARWNRSRIMFVGQGKAGKSASVRSLLGERYVDEWDSTIGADISESKVTTSVSPWEKCTDSSEDFTSNFAARIMARNMNKKDLSSKNSEKGKISLNRDKEVEEVNTNTDSTEDQGITGLDQSTEGTTLSNGQDVNEVEEIEIEIEEEEEEEIEEEEEEEYREYSSELIKEAKHDLNALNLSLWDFGGQQVFYSMHHIFLTENGVYVLVFDMREILDAGKRTEAKNYILFWLRSIRLHAPHAPLFLMGTFRAELNQNDIKEVDSVIQELSKLNFPQIVRNVDEELILFPVDNKTSEGISKLRAKINEAVSSDETVSQEFSIRWMKLLDKVLENRKTKSYLTLSDVRKMARKVDIVSAREVDETLRLFHERGMLIHLTTTEVLKNIIIINPQWLVESISKIIRDSSLHHYDRKEIESVGLEKDVRMLFEKGIASRDFLEFVWKHEQVDFLIDLMMRTMLMSEWEFTKEKCYLIPSLIQEKFQGEMVGIRCEFDFSTGFLPTGIFQRLICLCVAHSSSCNNQADYQIKEPELYENFSSIEFERGIVLNLLEDIETHRIVVYVQNDESARKGPAIIKSVLQKVNYDVMGSKLKWEVYFEDKDEGRLISEVTATKQGLKPWFEETEFLEASQATFAKQLDFDSFLDM